MRGFIRVYLSYRMFRFWYERRQYFLILMVSIIVRNCWGSYLALFAFCLITTVADIDLTTLTADWVKREWLLVPTDIGIQVGWFILHLVIFLRFRKVQCFLPSILFLVIELAVFLNLSSKSILALKLFVSISHSRVDINLWQFTLKLRHMVGTVADWALIIFLVLL